MKDLYEEFHFPRIFEWNGYLSAIVFSQGLPGGRTEGLQKCVLFFGGEIKQIKRQESSASKDCSLWEQECEHVNSSSSW